MGNYVFLGPPGAGKGTMADLLAEHHGHVHISTGDILREEMKGGSELGRQAKQYVDSGKLVPDDVVAAIVEARLSKPEAATRGVILDGYPRTVKQAELLDGVLARCRLGLTAVVLFEVERDLLLRRLTARRVCRQCGAVYNIVFNPPAKPDVCNACGGPLYQRSDDNETTVGNRLAVYESETAPLVGLYERRHLLIRVPGSQEKNENFRTLCRALGVP